MKNKDVKLYNISEMSITHSEANYKLEKEYLKERIILNTNQFTKRTLFHENLITSIIILKIKVFIQFFKLLVSLFLQFIIPNYKFKFFYIFIHSVCKRWVFCKYIDCFIPLDFPHIYKL